MGLNKEARKQVEEYILEGITSEDEELKTSSDKIKHVLKRFNSEYAHMIERVGKYRAFSEWLQGLALDFDFMNYEIIKLGNKWGFKLDNERTEDLFLNQWWDFLAMHFFRMCRKHGAEE